MSSDRDHHGRWRALTAALLDDAAIFPPGNAPVPAAVTAHRSHRTSPHADLVGPFVCAASRVPELQDALGPATGLDPLLVVLVADSGVMGVEQATHLLLDDDRLELVGLEVALPREGDPAVFAEHVLAALAFAVPTAVEIPRVPGWQQALDVLAADGAERAKFRTGGPTPEHVPSPEALAELVVEAVRRRVPFKLTAGLHRALRHVDDATGGTQHGFLNALAATALATDGADVADVAAVLTATDAATVLAPLEQTDAAALRRSFLSFGTCSIDEPVGDLVALGLLEAAPA